ncbi:MAG TPA: LamG-like jellyroll fold domain-containing protein [Candidatus Saccharimonadales bacterium]|nr:LamG-like jellyroll fold domain-containing protein [Candidatus Saccharimonadales bacterium]
MASVRRKIGVISGIIVGLVGIGLITSGITSADSLPNTGAPQGFSLSSVAEGLELPTAAQFAPDGRIFVIQKGGEVRIVKNGQLLAEPFYTVPNLNQYVDRGLLGLALDPNFATNKYVYLLYTYENNAAAPDAAKTGRLIRVTANGDKALAGSEQIILGNVVGSPAQPSCDNFPVNTDCIPADGYSHAPASLVFGPDGKLYASLGDAARYDDVDTKAFRAQNIDSLAGKILRINTDGTGLADNPYYNGNPNDIRSKVYAYGMRNPFRMNVRASDGLVMVGDVGWNDWEEVNTVPRGANLGWPCYEGNAQQTGTGTGSYKDFAFCQQMYQNPPANLKFPAHVYPHPPSSAAVGGLFYTGDNYPVTYKDRYFYGDFAKNQMYTLSLDTANQMVPGSNQLFASNVAGPVSFFTGPGGDIYFVGIMTGSIYHMTYSTANQGPTAFIAADKTFGPSPLTVNFTSSGSTDPEGDDLAFLWDFGDGGPTSAEPNPTRTFTVDGTYTVTLTVSDEFNNRSVKTLAIHAGQTAPTVVISSPANMSSAVPGQVINFAGSANDVQDGTMPPEKLNWQVIIQHCPLDSCHVHTVMTTTGAGGSFNFPAHDGPFYIQIMLSVTNSAGLTSTKSVSVYPQGQKITHALQLDGINDYAVADNPQDFQLQQFTAEAMIKTLSTDTDGGEIMSMGNNWVLRALPGGALLFSYNNAETWQTLVATNTNVVDGLWHHVAVTRTATTVKLYVDGALLAQAANANPIEYVYANDFMIGRHGSGADNFHFNGTIDEVRFWAMPRTDADIAKYQSMTLPSSGQTGLVAYYKIEEGEGISVADASPSQAHKLTLVNGVGWIAGAPLSEPPLNTPITDIQDTFTGTAVDTGKWQFIGATTRTQQNDVLTITPQTTGRGYFGLMSKATYELKTNAVFVEVPQATNSGTAAETQLILERDANNKIIFGRSNSGVYLRHRVNGVDSSTNIAYSATTMRWWRIREAGGTVFMETSPDAATWTVRRSFPKAFDLSRLKVVLQAGTYQAVANPGVAKFDNLNTPPPAAAPNNALSLDGLTGKASVNSSSLYNTQAFTLETWAKVQATGTGGAELLSNGNNYGLRVQPNGNLLFFAHTGGLIWKTYLLTDVNLKDNAWHHIAITKDATSVKIYLDGVLRNTFAAPETISYTLGNTLALGQHSEGDGNFNLTGQLDEIRVWNIARTTTQIVADKNKELAAQAGLVGYWQFNEATGFTAPDSSGNNNPLTLTAGATRTAGFPRQ